MLVFKALQLLIKTFYYLQMLPQLHYFFLDILMKVLPGEGERGCSSISSFMCMCCRSWFDLLSFVTLSSKYLKRSSAIVVASADNKMFLLKAAKL
jgi:hypothetical protein